MSKNAKDIVDLAKSYLGVVGGKQFIDVYNNHKPLARGYKVKYTDSWCATFISALSIKLGYTDIIPTECSCLQMLNKAKTMGTWIEDDSITPCIGDLILYDWGDNGKGDNTGVPDHIGIVVEVDGNVFVTVEGNVSNKVSKRNMFVNGKNIRGYIRPKYQPVTKTTTRTPEDYLSVVKCVLAGDYGTGTQRRYNLKMLGYNPDKVQKIINALMS